MIIKYNIFDNHKNFIIIKYNIFYDYQIYLIIMIFDKHRTLPTPYTLINHIHILQTSIYY